MLMIDERMSKFVGRIQAHSGAVTTVGMHSSGLTLASGGCDGFVRCWDIRQRKLLYEKKVGLEIRVYGLGFVRCWDIRQRKLLYEKKVGLEIRV
jgi:WD40 repeat protein